jgi:hypothetical protein
MRSEPENNLKHPRRRRSIQGYVIRTAGQLECNPAEWYADLTIANLENGDALLTGAIPDQAALMRILLRLHDRGISILSVKAVRRRR